MAFNWKKITPFGPHIVFSVVSLVVLILYLIMLLGCLGGSNGIADMYWAFISTGGGTGRQIRIGYFGLCVREPTGQVCFSFRHLPREPTDLASSPLIQSALSVQKYAYPQLPVFPAGFYLIGTILHFLAPHHQLIPVFAELTLFGSAVLAMTSALACLGLGKTLEGGARIVNGAVEGQTEVKAGMLLINFALATAVMHILLVGYILWGLPLLSKGGKGVQSFDGGERGGGKKNYKMKKRSFREAVPAAPQLRGEPGLFAPVPESRTRGKMPV